MYPSGPRRRLLTAECGSPETKAVPISGASGTPENSSGAERSREGPGQRQGRHLSCGRREPGEQGGDRGRARRRARGRSAASATLPGAGPAPSQGFPKGQGCTHCVATMVIFTEVIGGFIFLSSGLFNSAFVILRLSIYRSFIPRLFKFLFWVH